MRFEIVIIGGGPAGATLALKAPENRSVLLIEKRFLLDPDRVLEKEKCCGGMLDPSAQKTLAHLGFGIPKEVMQDPEVFGVKAVDFESRMERFYQRNYLNINRPLFDAMLLQKAAKRPNVTVWTGARLTGIREENDKVILVVRKDQDTVEIETDCLVGADGGNSFVRHYLKEKYGRLTFREARRYISIQEWYEQEEPLPYYMALFDRRVTDFYGWIIPKGRQILVGAAIPDTARKKHTRPRTDALSKDVSEDTLLQDKNALERFEIFKQDLMIKGFDLSDPKKRLGATILRPRGIGSVNTGRGRIFLVGEAASLISPSSSEGISFALRSGEALAKADFNRKAYERRLFKLKLTIFVKSLKAPLMYHPLLRRIIFKTKLTSFEIDETLKSYRKERWE